MPHVKAIFKCSIFLLFHTFLVTKPSKGPILSFECGTFTCASASGKRIYCSIPRAVLILHMDHNKTISSAYCFSRRYGHTDSEIWVQDGCRGEFDVCYISRSSGDLEVTTSNEEKVITVREELTLSSVRQDGLQLTTSTDQPNMQSEPKDQDKDTSSDTLGYFGIVGGVILIAVIIVSVATVYWMKYRLKHSMRDRGIGSKARFIDSNRKALTIEGHHYDVIPLHRRDSDISSSYSNRYASISPFNDFHHRPVPIPSISSIVNSVGNSSASFFRSATSVLNVAGLCQETDSSYYAVSDLVEEGATCQSKATNVFEPSQDEGKSCYDIKHLEKDGTTHHNNATSIDGPCQDTDSSYYNVEPSVRLQPPE